MKANSLQSCICDVIHSQSDFWKRSNDITSPTHIVDIEEECRTKLCDLMSDEEVDELSDKLSDLYRFIRKFDKRESDFSPQEDLGISNEQCNDVVDECLLCNNENEAIPRETNIEKELAECYLRVFDKKFALPKIKGKQLHDFKNFINTCEQTFSMKYFDYHATQGKLFEKLALLWAVWGAEHLNDIHISNKLEDIAKKLWSELNTGHSYSVIDSYNIFYGVCLDVANWQREQMMNNVPDDVEEAANEYLCGCKSRVASYKKNGFIAGANWRKYKIEKAVIAEQDCTCIQVTHRIVGGSWNLACPTDKLGLGSGDKVKVMIVKSE